MSSTNQKPVGLNYIDHIDGLRLIAVLLVMLFHARLGGFTGGYVGVDVFFVVSGFLMTRILRQTRFDLAGLGGFFAGRLRRTGPAYLVCVAVVTAVFAVVLLPVHLEKMAPSVLAAFVFLTNFVFYRTTSYFSPDLTFNPLLHTWSLAVELQFYLTYPIIIWIGLRLKRLNLVILAAALISLAISAYLVQHGKVIAAFYLLPARYWEFMVGGLVATLPTALQKRRPGPALSAILSILALAVIGLCAMRYTSETPFPGLAALPVCLAAAILIQTADGFAPLRAALTAPPVRMLGQASYSIYLWHWPIIVLLDYGIFHGAVLDAARPLIIFAGAILLGLASWRYVETPFRKKPSPGTLVWPKRAALALCVVAASILAVASIKTRGLPARFPASVVRLSDAYADVGAFRQCLAVKTEGDPTFSRLCRLGGHGADAAHPVDFVLAGDSLAAALSDGMAAMADQRGVVGVLSATDSCPPIIGYPGGFLPTREHCQKVQADLPHIVDTLRPRTVILHGNWDKHIKRAPALFEPNLDKTVAMLVQRHVRVIIIDTLPSRDTGIAIALAKQSAFGAPFKPMSTAEFRASTHASSDILRRIASRYGAIYISPADSLCPTGGDCASTIHGLPILWDGDHLTGAASLYVGDIVSRKIPADYIGSAQQHLSLGK